MKTSYRTDLTEEQWELLRQLISPAQRVRAVRRLRRLEAKRLRPEGRPRTVDMREVVNAILYMLMAGCPWSLLPHDFPKCKTVYFQLQTHS